MPPLSADTTTHNATPHSSTSTGGDGGGGSNSGSVSSSRRRIMDVHNDNNIDAADQKQRRRPQQQQQQQRQHLHEENGFCSDDEREFLIRRGGSTISPSSSPSKTKYLGHEDSYYHSRRTDATSRQTTTKNSSSSSSSSHSMSTPLKAVSFHDEPNRYVGISSQSSSTSTTTSSCQQVDNRRRRTSDIDSESGNSSGSEAWLISKVPFFLRRYVSSVRQKLSVPTTGWKMLRLWLFGMIAPLGVVTWTITNQFSAVVISILALPTIAIIQGSVAILKYRVKYGDSPLPLAPSHGIVKCISSKASSSTTTTTTTIDASDAPGTPSTPLLEVDGIIKKSGTVVVDGDANDTSNNTNASPLRLLVIGDSLAVGVGQSKCSTPIMPETIAKSLSKSMNGRPVLWTCHGAPGASAGWIVRELERSFRHGQFIQQQTYYPLSPVKTKKPTLPRDEDLQGEQYFQNDDNQINGAMNDISSRSFDSASSSSSSSFASLNENQDGDNDDEAVPWSERLKDHKIRFDPDVLGPFDIAIVLTGSNDLKSAFFPFLLTGEDAEFRRQAQQRGGGYDTELTRILQVLNERMRMKLQTLRHQVEVAKDRVLESVDTIRERLHSHDMTAEVKENSQSGAHPNVGEGTVGILVGNDGVDSKSTARIDPRERDGSYQKSSNSHTNLNSTDMLDDNTNHTVSSHGALNSSMFPMVVLPGLPARALPIFNIPPLRWLAVPIVDIMDSHKETLSKHHDGEVLFVDAPPADTIAEYACQEGMYRDDEEQDRILLRLRDIKKRRKQRIESDMAQYSNKKGQPRLPEDLPHGKKHFAVFSEDGIHPNDAGYAFWGRHIANAIVEEWKRKQNEQGIHLV
mmetsp:Transcript_32145/g.78352  ORF Transcript_32145/g.78352 Transcript_32145/m.78352 type:complete len:855 (+) Transcript_32145:302-2866(+)